MQSTDLVGTEDAARIFGVDRSTITRWVNAGKLHPAVRLPGAYLFDRGDLERIAQ